MSKVGTYNCIIMETTPITDPKLFEDAECLVEHFKDEDYASIPMSSTLESEAMGAVAELGKVSKYKYDNVDDIVIDFDYNQKHVKALFEAIHKMKDKKRVIVEVSGPLIILDNLVSSEVVFRSFRKKHDRIVELYDEIRKVLVEYIEKLVDSGIKLISFSDSLAGADIIGPKQMQMYVDEFLMKFLEDIQNIDKPFNFHLCPKSTMALISLNKAEFRQIEKDEEQRYVDFLFEGEHKIFGDRCMNLLDKKFKKINEIIIRS
ncbi:uroporphyrinogen decarboxylase family protein [Finegoldia magna]|uniref:uroporphyrinogen decarboxylase family protein n=1 Tax=Finegoldia magna TaxID=1260 RepID=UPI002904F1F4|nr:uroporphyrinogen decarboxylase family protein [Finegoldia magna]MDU1213242.1 uroporphyrinogen decarboxylase family protein [Finegoldia magna]MDU5442296.1 uroporphyrinogen decarboxylase family protein [Finegoldia magna]